MLCCTGVARRLISLQDLFPTADLAKLVSKRWVDVPGRPCHGNVVCVLRSASQSLPKQCGSRHVTLLAGQDCCWRAFLSMCPSRVQSWPSCFRRPTLTPWCRWWWFSSFDAPLFAFPL